MLQGNTHKFTPVPTKYWTWDSRSVTHKRRDFGYAPAVAPTVRRFRFPSQSYTAVYTFLLSRKTCYGTNTFRDIASTSSNLLPGAIGLNAVLGRLVLIFCFRVPWSFGTAGCRFVLRLLPAAVDIVSLFLWFYLPFVRPYLVPCRRPWLEWPTRGLGGGSYRGIGGLCHLRRFRRDREDGGEVVTGTSLPFLHPQVGDGFVVRLMPTDGWWVPFNSLVLASSRWCIDNTADLFCHLWVQVCDNVVEFCLVARYVSERELRLDLWEPSFSIFLPKWRHFDTYAAHLCGGGFTRLSVVSIFFLRSAWGTFGSRRGHQFVGL